MHGSVEWFLFARRLNMFFGRERPPAKKKIDTSVEDVRLRGSAQTLWVNVPSQMHNLTRASHHIFVSSTRSPSVVAETDAAARGRIHL